ncbi:arylsulfotransferase family protein [Streptomyces formicae]|uniref:Arylsulfotransferase family protein n=1 Tax=Streptomyces formicae TaxID=1616117 RepID=A0ABY3WV64_9ACTN|nr:arylsulfotransferase family protein [Streptomyces formicae]
MAERQLGARSARRRLSRIAGVCVIVAGFAFMSCPPPAAAGPRPDRPRLCATEPAPPTGSATTPPPITSGSDVWSFVSEPGLHPQRVTVTAHEPGTARGKIFVGPYAIGAPVVGQTGALISDNSGDPVWFRPLPSPDLQNADFKVQTYHHPRTGKTQPVLTWWQGSIAIPPTYTNLPGGAPEPGGCYYIYDNHYRLLKTVFAHHGFYPDEHEFLLTRRGTALFIATKPVPMDLTPYGGPKDGAILDSEIQEVDLETGKLVFSWDLLDHLDPAESEVSASDAATSGGVWDAFHLNSIDEGPRGELLISLRNFWAIYDISRRTGQIRWQLGGKESDFTFSPDADFYWQHDARFGPDGKISLFDDGCCNQPDGTPEQESHGLVLDLDFDDRRATAARTYYHQPPLFSASQGNTQTLSNGNKFIGWGQSSYYSEYANAGNTEGNGSENLLYDAKLPGSNISYRAFRNKWVGKPYYPPSAAAKTENGHSVVYASWNGSTQTRAWRVLAGPDPDSLSVVERHAERTGFETAIPTDDPGPYFQVKALDKEGRVLKSSDIVTLAH